MTDISPADLKARLDQGETPTVIDVREEWEFEEKNIGAKLIPLGDIPQRLSELEELKDQEIIVHCKAGGRSAQAQKFLKSKGFSNVRNLTGGIEAYLAL